MANIYVRSTDGSDADNGSTWALAKATIAGALAIAAAGDTIWVSQAHAETTGAADKTLTCSTDAASPSRILCGNDASEPPTAPTTGASVTTTSTRAINITGYAYIYGIAFVTGSGSASNANNFLIGTTTANGNGLVFDACTFNQATTGSGAGFTVGTGSTGADDSLIRFTSCTFTWGNVGQKLTIAGQANFEGCSLALTGSVPTFLVQAASGIGGPSARFRNCDLTSFGSGKSLVNIVNVAAVFEFWNCALGSSVAATTGSFSGPGGPVVRLANCDSADTNYGFSQSDYLGVVTHETTIVRTSGASDGTTAVSRKLASAPNTNKWFQPLTLPLGVFWNESLSSQTITVEIVNDGVTLTDAEAWVEVDYPSNASLPIYSTATDRSASLVASGTNQTSSSESWTTTGLASPVKQKLEVTFTALNKGPLYVRVCLAKASTTLYADAKVLSTSGRQYQAGPTLYVNEGATAAGGGLLVHPGMTGGMRG